MKSEFDFVDFVGHLELDKSVKDQILAKAKSLNTRHTFLHFMPKIEDQKWQKWPVMK